MSNDFEGMVTQVKSMFDGIPGVEVEVIRQPAGWDGEGLPPVGCECEVKRAMDWMKCKILFISEHHVVLKSKEEICWQTQSCQFRPMRTESERKRDESIAAMRNFATNYNNTAVIHAIEQVYDSIAAGKIPHITLK